MLKNEFGENLRFDDPEALELLLQTITQHGDPSVVTDPAEDWSRMSSWVAQDGKPADFGNEFNFTFPMDLDVDPLNMAVDPSSLHFNTSIFSQAALSENPYYSLPQNPDVSSASMFSFDASSWPTGSHMEPGTARRLSLTSSSSSSGASLSPMLESQSSAGSPPSSDCGTSDSDPAFELAQRARQAAGVTLAVPVSPQAQQLAAASQEKPVMSRTPRQQPSPAAAAAPAKTPKELSPILEVISRASPPASTPSESGSTTSASSSATQSPNLDAPAPTPRPKTSHTTIERRYRTNLNARITGLRQSVPALRVLELKDGIPSPYGDIVDSRGFVDGVKVARKMSKANILGKATEYIRVLKKREARLKQEQDGLKSLVGGLVGGPALLKEWEREWRELFGGEEKDEIEGNDTAAGSDDEDGDCEDSDGEDEEGRARKKAKVAKPPKKERPTKPTPPPAVPAVPGAVPEKRKRGRPRKVPLPPAVPATTLTPMEGVTATIIPPIVPVQQDIISPVSQPTPQYLLAVFAFFSVLNSPLASSFGRTNTHAHSEAHTHRGTVLNAYPTMIPTASAPVARQTYGLGELVQAFHLLVSTMVFFYIVFPWLSGAFRHHAVLSAVIQRLRSYATRVHKPSPVSMSPVNSRGYVQRIALVDALSQAARGAPDEAARLRQALGVTTGVFGLMQGVIKAARIDRGLEMNQLEQRAWVRLGELVAFDGSMPKTTRLQTYWCMSWHVSTFATSTSDLTTLALMILPVSSTKATELWDRAADREVLRPHERIVLSNMSVNDAAEWLEKWRRWHDTERKGGRCAACEKRTPLGVLAAILIRERLRKHAAAMFVRSVVPNEIREISETCDSDNLVAAYDSEKDYQDGEQLRETIEAGKSIGGRTAELATFLERIWDTGFCSHEDVLPRSYAERNEGQGWEDEHDLARSDEAEIRALLSATLVYRRIFPSSFPSCATAVSVILSPPPSPSRKNLALHVSLRAALASSAFDFEGKSPEDLRLAAALEDARDRVNDMLTALERSLRRNVKAL
ncbi:uncharacterized protein PHACADRAFT_253666 [Phanerochaete carnosa HHB-10118-sp]|uniref:BHLH domain-containing protein n=1 Tax=Phanerochaete carnosa (strain HHB-10118-sp) TaxID=650164 RepID=K5VY46_PHACS|nr:uncharacterized protein PHACADRAFT_253666 [Phanerochaete carnosa HHB-10118-sp]EKM56498.1 hypothetical protein PHACADRAFT_253666 [Phanerochaete carnosa HHB-10118-sp]